jgi:2-dehydropantoate 2-reductase
LSAIAVLGPGGVGGLVAAALARTGDQVTVVARDTTAEVIARDGIRVESVTLGEFSAQPAVVSRLESAADVLVVATKATGLQDALERIAVEPDLVVPLLNGLDHVELLRRRFGPRAVAGSIRVESHTPEPGRVVHTSPWGAEISMASADPAPHEAMEAFAAHVRAARLSAEVLDSEARVMWRKLVRLCALALTTTAFDASLGDIRSNLGHRAALQACLREVALVATAEGVEIDADAALAKLDEDHPGLDSSMHRDVVAGREPELDAIAGAVLRAAARHGLECSTVATLAARAAQRAGIAPPGPST